MALDKNLFRNWIDGDVFSARDYVYERNTIIDYVNALPTVDNVLAEVAEDYYSKSQLNAGQLNNLYFTETELTTTGVLDGRYYTEGEVNSQFNADRNRLATLEATFGGVYDVSTNPNGLLGDGGAAQFFNQRLKKTDAVEFLSVKLGANVVNEAFIDGLENKYTQQQVDAALALKISLTEKGAANGVATLDGDGRLPVEQLPLNTVVFRGTFGDGVGDLPTTGVETGDFYICVSNGYVSAVAGKTFDTGDKAVYDGTNWSKIDNTETVTSVNGDVGAVVLDYTDVGAAAASHPHGNITNEGKIGETGDLVVTTGVDGTLTTATRSGIDSRVSFPPGSHTHGNISNTGAIGSTDDLVVVTGTNGVLTTASRDGIDSRTEYPPVAHNHDDRYFTETELDPAADPNLNVLDARYYTQTQVNSSLAGYVPLNQKGAANGVVPLNAQTKIDATYLPSYVDDVVEGYYDSANDLFYEDAGFTQLITPLSGKIFVNLTDKKIYRYSGSGYFEIAANSVNSVNGYTGNITLAGSDLAIEAEDIDVVATGFDGVLTTDDTDLQTALATIDAHTHDFVDITNRPLLYTQAEVDAFLAEKADVADLSASISLYPTTTPSEVTGYFTMVMDITDDRYNDVAFDVGTGAISQQNQLIASLASDANIFTGNPGVINVTTIGNIRKTAGNSSQYAEFFYRIFQRKFDGTEILIGTSDTTGAVNPENGNYYEFSAAAVLNNGTFESSDRLVIKYYANALEGTVSEYDFQFGGNAPIRTLLPVPVRVLQSAERIIYDNSTGNLTSTNLQDAVDELDLLIQQNTSVLKIQRFVINNADNGDGTFTYTYNGGSSTTAPLVGGQYRFPLQESVEYILGQNRLEIKVNNNINFYSPDLEIEEIDTSTVGVTYALQANDEVFIKVYQGLDSVALDVADGSITSAKLSTGLNNKITSYDNHLADTSIHFAKTDVSKSDVGLGNVTNDAQVKADVSGSIDGNVPVWVGTNGDQIGTGYGVQTTLTDTDFELPTAGAVVDAISTEVSTLNSAISGKQDTLVSGTNIKSLNGVSLLGSGDYEIDIPSVEVSETAPDIQTSNVGDLWWDSTSAVLYIAYDDGTSKQWVEVSYAAVQEAISNLVAGAPGALDTLNELAAALGDDPNFATTITNAIAAKADQSAVDTLTTAVAAKADKAATVNSTTITADYTFIADDAAKIRIANNSNNITLSVPLNNTVAYPIGTKLEVLRKGSGNVTFEGISEGGFTTSATAPTYPHITTKNDFGENLNYSVAQWEALYPTLGRVAGTGFYTFIGTEGAPYFGLVVELGNTFYYEFIPEGESGFWGDGFLSTNTLYISRPDIADVTALNALYPNGYTGPYVGAVAAITDNGGESFTYISFVEGDSVTITTNDGYTLNQGARAQLVKTATDEWWLDVNNPPQIIETTALLGSGIEWTPVSGVTGYYEYTASVPELLDSDTPIVSLSLPSVDFGDETVLTSQLDWSYIYSAETAGDGFLKFISTKQLSPYYTALVKIIRGGGN